MHTSRLTDRAVIRAFLAQDRGLTAYALGDLDDAFWPDSAFSGAWHGDTLESILLVYTGLDPAVLTGFGSVDGLAAILEAITLPDEIYYLWLPEAEALLDARYVRPHAKREFRMVLARDALALPDLGGVRRIGEDDLPALDALFRQAAEPGEEVVAFGAHQLAHGAFYGVWQGDTLVAAAGTHVWSVSEGVAAIGNVFTAPDHRGHGYATRCTAAVTQAALDAGLETIVLNVRHDNESAIHVYEKLGFRIYRTFLEGPGQRRTVSPQPVLQ